MPNGIPTDVLKACLEDNTHALLPEQRSDTRMFMSEAAMLPLALLSVATSLKRIADTVGRIDRSGLKTYEQN